MITTKNVGTKSDSVASVVEYGDAKFHVTEIAISSAHFADIPGGADLALGQLLYTFPTGAIVVKGAYMNIALNESDGNITADTPDVGIGTTVASGVVNVLGGTAAFENILTGQTATDCDSTYTTKTLALADPLEIETGGDKTVYLNVADGWAASGEDALEYVGTVVIEWVLLKE